MLHIVGEAGCKLGCNKQGSALSHYRFSSGGPTASLGHNTTGNWKVFIFLQGNIGSNSCHTWYNHAICMWITFFGVLHLASEGGRRFINQAINIKYGMTSKMWKHPGQTTACFPLSAAPYGPKLVYMLISVLRGGMWWRA